jgi:hypothetical protein
MVCWSRGLTMSPEDAIVALLKIFLLKCGWISPPLVYANPKEIAAKTGFAAMVLNSIYL